MKKPIESKTERLLLRQWREADLEPFAAYNSDPQVMEFYPKALDRTASDALATRFRSLIDKRGWGFWAVDKKDSNEFVGFVGLHETGPELPFSPCVEIGWRLGAAYWGKGYATEAAKESLRIGFEILNLEEIVSFTAAINQRSRAVMERLDMNMESETFAHPNVPRQSPLSPHCLYRLTRKQWQANLS